jgi:acetyl esterase
MALDPFAKAFLDQIAASGLPKTWTLSPEQARRNSSAVMEKLCPKDEPVGKVENLLIPGPGGDLALRLYTPVAAGSEALPALVYFHGGGMVLGNLDTHDGVCRVLAALSGCRVVAVDYRRAPEHKFPASVEDAYAAVSWVEANAAEHGIDANRIAVIGDSAGGTLSAVVCLLAKEKGAPKIGFQVPMFPMTDALAATGSRAEFAEGYFLEKRSIDWFYGHFLPEGTDAADPLVSPLRAPDMSGLPPAFVMVAGCDPLHDEGLAYADKLRAAGVPVSVADYPGQLHSFVNLSAAFPKARAALGDAAKAVRIEFQMA